MSLLTVCPANNSGSGVWCQSPVDFPIFFNSSHINKVVVSLSAFVFSSLDSEPACEKVQIWRHLEILKGHNPSICHNIVFT